MRRLRAAVVGAGHLGRFHAEKYAAMHDVELAAVVDTDLERARHVAAPSGASVYADHHSLAGKVDVASVVVPTVLHYSIARDLLQAGIHVLVEKPFTASVDEGRELISHAVRCKRVLQVGHIERFNPVTQALLARVDTPMFIEMHRIAPFKPRGTDVDVVLDLMIHDIDVMLQLVQSPIVQIDASGGPVLTSSIDIANARVQFANGCVANLTASRVSAKSERRMRVFQRNAYFSADLGNRALSVYRKGDDSPGSVGLQSERLELNEEDALEEEISAFLACVHDGSTPLVSGADGLLALQVATEVTHCIHAGPPLEPALRTMAAEALAAHPRERVHNDGGLRR
jgi:predicted dehydrogenase